MPRDPRSWRFDTWPKCRLPALGLTDGIVVGFLVDRTFGFMAEIDFRRSSWASYVLVPALGNLVGLRDDDSVRFRLGYADELDVGALEGIKL